MINPKDLYDLKDAARDMTFVMTPVKVQDISEDARGVVLEGERQREAYIQYHGDSKSENVDKSKTIAKYLIAVNPAKVQHLVAEIERLTPFEKHAETWKNNHDNQVSRALILTERPDMPVERVKAYNRMYELENENKRLQAEIANLKDPQAVMMMLGMIQRDMQADRYQVQSMFNQIIGVLGRVFRI